MLDTIPGRVYTAGVSFLVALIAYPSQCVFALPLLKESSWWTYIKVLGPLNLLVIMVYYNYYLTVTTDPGSIPSQWIDTVPPTLLVPANEQRRAEGITGPRFCKTCNTYKPPRSHHCRTCRRCVLKMDHHCPWINNCVGHYNQGHFIRFITYVTFACSYVMGLIIWRIRSIMSAIQRFEFDLEPDTFEAVVLMIEFLLTSVILFSVGVLNLYQFYCLARNQTTIEAWERTKVNRLIRKGKISLVHYPFDIGVYQNICSVLGSNPLLWLWPQKVPGNGLSFPVRPNINPGAPYYWPPRDPDDLQPSIFSSRYKNKSPDREEGIGENETIESDDYYDSGSQTDSSEYSLGDEERVLMRPRLHIARAQHHRRRMDANGLPVVTAHADSRTTSPPLCKTSSSNNNNNVKSD
ncbi:DHHC palmitoyltransferase-domain-containing protein [Dichotomocladium elegans]|nr:DHHC palmitoyltransferase-domain-containing protein [Dichotomocladium elegans]